MSYTVTSTNKAEIALAMQVTRTNGSYTYSPPGLGAAITYTNGTGVNQVNKAFEDNRSVNASTNDDIDLSGGTIKDIEGNVATFAAVKSICIVNTHATQDLTVFGGTNPFLGPLTGTTPAVTIKPGGYIHFENPTAAGWAVTNASNDNLRIANGAGVTGTYKIILLGI